MVTAGRWGAPSKARWTWEDGCVLDGVLRTLVLSRQGLPRRGVSRKVVMMPGSMAVDEKGRRDTRQGCSCIC